jgi:putative DNA primase/helicase
MNAQPVPNPEVAAITAPAPLRGLPAWVVWKFEAPEGGGKPRKVPFYANGGRRRGRHGAPEDRRQLVTFEIARAAAARRGFDGVGFATLEDWGITALDFDGCMREGRVVPEVLAAIEGTYAEMSPSGAGVRAFVRGAVRQPQGQRPRPAVRRRVLQQRRLRHRHRPRAGPVAMQGDPDTIADASPALRSLAARRFGSDEPDEQATGDAPPLGLTEVQIRECLDVLPKDMGYDDWIKVGMALHHETAGEGFDIWDAWSAAEPQVHRPGLRQGPLGQLRPRRPAAGDRALAGQDRQRERRARRPDRAVAGRLRRDRAVVIAGAGK